MMYYITYILTVTTCFGFQYSHLQVTITFLDGASTGVYNHMVLLPCCAQ